MAGTGGSVARSAGLLASGVSRGARGWADALAAFKRRLSETVGFALLLAAALLAASLLSYDPRDPSLDTAVDGGTHNLLGQDGAMLADLLRQALGLAAYLIPLVLAGWSLRLMLNPRLYAPWRKLALLPAALLLAALAFSVLDFGPASAPAGSGGAIGWTLQRLCDAAGLAHMTLPLSMAAAAFLGLSLLSILGLSWRDWRDLGGGAGRGASAAAGLCCGCTPIGIIVNASNSCFDREKHSRYFPSPVVTELDMALVSVPIADIMESPLNRALISASCLTMFGMKLKRVHYPSHPAPSPFGSVFRFDLWKQKAARPLRVEFA